MLTVKTVSFYHFIAEPRTNVSNYSAKFVNYVFMLYSLIKQKSQETKTIFFAHKIWTSKIIDLSRKEKGQHVPQYQAKNHSRSAFSRSRNRPSQSGKSNDHFKPANFFNKYIDHSQARKVLSYNERNMN